MLATRLKYLRESKDLTQIQLAEKLDIGRSSISNYEKGERSPDASILLKYSNFFNVSMDYIFGISNFRNLEVENLFKQFDEKTMAILLKLSSETTSFEDIISSSSFQNYFLALDMYHNPTDEDVKYYEETLNRVKPGISKLQEAMGLGSIREVDDIKKEIYNPVLENYKQGTLKDLDKIKK